MNQTYHERTGKGKIRPRSTLLILAAVLFAIPDLHVIDILPDALGYLLLLHMIAPYAIIDAHIR